jgi:ubiquinone/menaquinone biosynthesis C-methylase UbiE
MGRAAGIGVSWSPFDSLAESYDRWYETPLGSFADRLERQAVFDLLGARPGELILDVGSGTGRYARELAGQGVRCVGLDPSAAMLAIAQRGAPPGGPTHIRGIAERLPLASNVFDAVMSVATLEFVTDVDAALAEAARVAKPRGRLVVGVLNCRGPWAARRGRSSNAIWRAAHFFSQGKMVWRLQELGEVRSRLCVYVPPQLDRAPWPLLSLVEWLGARLAPSLGAFMAFRVDLRR